MKNIMFVRLSPNGNFMHGDKQYSNGQSLELPDDEAEALISCNLAVDIDADPSFADKIKGQLEKDNSRRSKIINKIEKRR